jgi:hypothetical protein
MPPSLNAWVKGKLEKGRRTENSKRGRT